MTHAHYKYYTNLKKKHPEAILLFRTEDSFSAYFEDAEKVARVLDITLMKDIGCDGRPISMTWFPRHCLDTYLPKMIRKGLRVAICSLPPEQEEGKKQTAASSPEHFQMAEEPKPVYKRATKYSLTAKKDRFDCKRMGNAQDAANFARKFYGDDISIYESAYVILLNKANLAIGYAKIGQGGVDGVPIDLKILCKYAIDSLASGIIFVHNHPSGRVLPSMQDITLATKIKDALNIFGINLVDSIIIAPEDGAFEDKYYSFKDEGKL